MGGGRQNESLNGGGTYFVNKHKDLRIRIVHGNTLTVAVILNTIGTDVKQIFLTGATSKIGRAVAIYLCRQGVRVMVSETYSAHKPPKSFLVDFLLNMSVTWPQFWSGVD